MNRTALCLSLLISPIPVLADYSFQIDGNYSEQESDAEATDRRSLNARYYFNKVNDRKGPLGEAAFLNRASSIAFGYSKSVSEGELSYIAPAPAVSGGPAAWSPADLSSLDLKTLDLKTLGTLLSNPNFLHGLIAGGNDFKAPADDPKSESWSKVADFSFITKNGWVIAGGIEDRERESNILATTHKTEEILAGFSIGKYIMPETLLAIAYRYTAAEEEAILFGGGVPGNSSRYSTDLNADNWSVVVKHLQPLGGMHLGLEFHTAYETSKFKSDQQPASIASFNSFANLSYQQPNHTNDSWQSGIASTLYPDANLGIRLSYDYIDAEGSQSKAYAVSSEWFVTRQLAVSAAYTYQDTEFFYNDSEGFAIGVTGRF